CLPSGPSRTTRSSARRAVSVRKTGALISAPVAGRVRLPPHRIRRTSGRRRGVPRRRAGQGDAGVAADSLVAVEDVPQAGEEALLPGGEPAGRAFLAAQLGQPAQQLL